MPLRATRPVVTLVLVALLVGCGDRSGKTLADPVFPPPETVPASTTPTTVPEVAAPLSLIAPWVDGAAVPERHTCRGAGVSPALTWSNVPAGAVELAVTVVDPDAGGFVHWIVYGLAPIETGLIEGQVPDAGFEWRNSAGVAGWTAVCPPAGETHRYEFTVHALNQQLEVADDAGATEVLDVIDATTIATSTVAGLATGG